VTAAELYPPLRGLHLTTVAVTIALFTLRGLWMLRASPLLGRRWVRIAPHTNDTLLLASGIGLAVVTGQAPGPQAWLTAKLVGLVAYIGLGLVAMRFGRSRLVRAAAFAAALATVAYIVAVALTRRALPLG
jgi:uncharacterized membrane protein SirB2